MPLIVGAAVALAPELLLASATRAMIRAMTATKLDRPSATVSHSRQARSLFCLASVESVGVLLVSDIMPPSLDITC
jgi:hypothetical protein